MKRLLSFFAGILILLASSCISGKRLIAIQVAQPHAQDSSLEEDVWSGILADFREVSARPVAVVQLPDASTLADSVLQLARSERVSYIVILSDTWIKTEQQTERYGVREIAALGFRVRVFDVRWKKMILNNHFGGTSFSVLRENKYLNKYPMSEIPYPLYTPPQSSKDRVSVPEKSAMNQAFDAALAELRETLKEHLR